MDLDPMEYVNNDEKELREEMKEDRAKSRLNTLIAVTVAILATFMGLCKVKDDNIVQQMQQDQAKSIDTWSWYQAKKTRVKVAEGIVDQLSLSELSAPAASKPMYEKKIAGYKKYVEKEKSDQDDVKKKAEDFDKDYDAWNKHDDQFDLSDAMLALSIALLAVTSLTQKKWLFGIAMIPTSIGVIYGFAGLMGLGLHSDLAAKWLGT
ncbi:MAG: DUF4337 domain-containing protein [Chthonomonadales bacterium]